MCAFKTICMSHLPSGLHFCINSQPLDDLLRQVQAGRGLHLPDLRMIHGPEDLRRHMRLLWLLPVGADCAVDEPLHRFSKPVPPGLTLVDSGHTFHRLPEHLDKRDREAMEQFWNSPRCRAFLKEQMERVRFALNTASPHFDAEDRYLSEWFPAPSTPALTDGKNLEEEMQAGGSRACPDH